VKPRRLRRNKDTAIGSRGKPASIEELKAHRGMTREQAESCGEVQARCGELVAIGDLSRPRSASFLAENHVGESA
jgi:hypothetical protein